MPPAAIDPQWIIAICSALGLLITWTGSVAAVIIWLVKRLDGVKQEILADLQAKHEENAREVAALRTLVIRHDTILDPEFNGTGKPSGRPRQ